MRAPKRKRPVVRTQCLVPPSVDLLALSARATYVGSPEHKDTPSFAGQPRPRADAAVCDSGLAGKQIQITDWLRRAIELGQIGSPWDGDFPRYVWWRDGATVYEARLVNRELGQYKGFPLNEDEHPPGI